MAVCPSYIFFKNSLSLILAGGAELIRTGGISAAAGPLGTGGQVAASLANPAAMFSYSRSKGKLSGRAIILGL